MPRTGAAAPGSTTNVTAVRVPELSKLLYDQHVPPDIYRVDGTHYELAHVLDKRDDGWVVFLSERAGESSPVRFTDEHDACTFFLGCVFETLARRGRVQITPRPV
jgi:hypothetical protein